MKIFGIIRTDEETFPYNTSILPWYILTAWFFNFDAWRQVSKRIHVQMDWLNDCSCVSQKGIRLIQFIPQINTLYKIHCPYITWLYRKVRITHSIIEYLYTYIGFRVLIRLEYISLFFRWPLLFSTFGDNCTNYTTIWFSEQRDIFTRKDRIVCIYGFVSGK